VIDFGFLGADSDIALFELQNTEAKAQEERDRRRGWGAVLGLLGGGSIAVLTGHTDTTTLAAAAVGGGVLGVVGSIATEDKKQA